MGLQPSTGDDEHVVDRLVEYLDGALTAADEFAIDSHLLHCAGCRSEYDELSTVALMLAIQPPGEPELDE